MMKVLKYGILLLVIFVASIYSAFLFENAYEKLIRNLFENLTSNNISFFHPKKYIRFASSQFVLSFGAFNITLIFLLSRQRKKQIIINLLVGILLMIISTIMFCYFEGSAKLIECTTCNDGRRILNYSDINYDMIFMISLVSAILPTLSTQRKLMAPLNIDKKN